MQANFNLDDTPIFKLFMSYFLPSLVGMLVLSTYVIVDGIFVGKGIGEAGLSAIGIVTPIFSLFIGIELLLGIGGAVLVGIALGENKYFKARVIFSSVIYFTILASLLLGVVLFICRDWLVSKLGANDEIAIYVRPYLDVILLGGVVILSQSILCSFARNDKAPRLVMISFVVGSIINIILNYIFIFIFKWGMYGASISTVAGHFIGLIIVLKHFICKNGDLYFIKYFNLHSVCKSLKNGLSPSISEFAFGFILLLMNNLLMTIDSTKGVAVLSIIIYISTICFSSMLAISHALQPIASYSYGANNKERLFEVFRISAIFAFALGIAVYILLFIFIPYIAKAFLNNDTQILPDLILAVRVYFIGYLFLGINIIIGAFLQSIGRVGGSIAVAICHNLLFMIIFLPIFAHYFGIIGVWSSYPVSLFCALVVGILVMKYENRKGIL